jgi:hypothetical protein
VIVYGVISSKTEHAVELFVRREDAEEMVENWRRDEPDDADLLRLETRARRLGKIGDVGRTSRASDDITEERSGDEGEPEDEPGQGIEPSALGGCLSWTDGKRAAL